MGKISRLFKTLWTVFYYLVVCYFLDRSRRVAFVNAVQTFQRREEHSLLFPTVELSELFPDLSAVDIRLRNFFYRPGNVSFGELCVLVTIARHLQPRTVFEIGTGDGNTTLQISLNTTSDCVTYTLDLPAKDSQTLLKADEGDRVFAGKIEVGERFTSHPEKNKIHQMRVDSATVDVSEFRHVVDFVFIDGSHSVEYVRHDTALALEMLSPNGVIVWHDFLVWSGVTDVLNELSKTMQLYHIAGTSLVLHKHHGEGTGQKPVTVEVV